MKSWSDTDHSTDHSTKDSTYWTLLLLTPRQGRYQVATSSRSEGVDISSRLVSTLSAVRQALSWASFAWTNVVENLERSLSYNSSGDFFADSADFSNTRRCAWVINTIDDHENLIAATLAEWDWYRSMNNVRQLALENEKVDKLLDFIATDYFRLKDSEARLKTLRERAKSRRDGVSSEESASAKPN